MTYALYINGEKYGSFSDKQQAKRMARLKESLIAKIEIKYEK